MGSENDMGSVEHEDGDELGSESPLHLLSLKTEPIRVSDISPNGKWFAFSTEDKLKVYSLSFSGLKCVIKKERVYKYLSAF